ncbi:MAG: hypothetical protein GY798_19695 [Hyphomicrobiales bacterium]|nr:hypothetical protein [Hyphomicrobiales bacterium]
MRSSGHHVFAARDGDGGAALVSARGERETDDRVMLCDPLTMLLSYDSFERSAINAIEADDHPVILFAIGDVDDLRGYVAPKDNNRAPGDFGHLAGNRCMAQIGRMTLDWEQQRRSHYRSLLAGTFGGDEVIIGAFGADRDVFCDDLGTLRDAIKANAPRPCTFAWGGVPDTADLGSSARDTYIQVVSAIDRSLFDYKAKARQAGRLINAALFEAGGTAS